MTQKTSGAFIAASWIALGVGMIGYLIGLWRAEMLLNEKGYYFTVLMFGLFAVISLQKSVRDRLEDLPVTERGDLFAIRTAGAYGEVMSSQYNLRDKPRTVLVIE